MNSKKTEFDVAYLKEILQVNMTQVKKQQLKKYLSK